MHSTAAQVTTQGCAGKLETVYRHLYEPDGHFTEHHLQDWQHSAMYLAFMLAGFIDLMAYYTQLPAGIDQVTSLTLLLHAQGTMLQAHVLGTCWLPSMLTCLVSYAG